MSAMSPKKKYYSVLFKDESSSMFDPLLQFHTEAMSHADALYKFKCLYQMFDVFDVYMDSMKPDESWFNSANENYFNNYFFTPPFVDGV